MPNHRTALDVVSVLVDSICRRTFNKRTVERRRCSELSRHVPIVVRRTEQTCDLRGVRPILLVPVCVTEDTGFVCRSTVNLLVGDFLRAEHFILFLPDIIACIPEPMAID